MLLDALEFQAEQKGIESFFIPVLVASKTIPNSSPLTLIQLFSDIAVDSKSSNLDLESLYFTISGVVTDIPFHVTSAKKINYVALKNYAEYLASQIICEFLHNMRVSLLVQIANGIGYSKLITSFDISTFHDTVQLYYPGMELSSETLAHQHLQKLLAEGELSSHPKSFNNLKNHLFIDVNKTINEMLNLIETELKNSLSTNRISKIFQAVCI